MQDMNKELEQIKLGVLRKFPLLGATMSNLKFIATDQIETACTDGKVVYYSPKFLENLDFAQKVFVFSHEIMHVAFDHILRSKGKKPKLWNIATDAVINQMLLNEKLPALENMINMAEAINKSAEEMYEKLLKEYEENKKKQKENQNGDGKQNGQGKQGEPQDEDDQENSGENGQNEEKEMNDDEEDENEQVGHDSHDIWKKAVEENDKEQESQENNGDKKQLDENDFSKKNKEEKEKIAEEVKNRIKQQNTNGGAKGGSFSGGVGETKKPILSWKKILKKEFEKNEERWSYRRANEENDYQARIGSFDIDDKPKTEVILDTSGSINDNLLKGFLRQLKPLLKESILKVGCFDTKFYGFTSIKFRRDIDEFKFDGRGGTDLKVPVQAFSKEREINKIIFTDGDATIPDENFLLSNNGKNIIWVVFDNERFNVSCGKVIHVKSSEMYETNLINNEEENAFSM